MSTHIFAPFSMNSEMNENMELSKIYSEIYPNIKSSEKKIDSLSHGELVKIVKTLLTLRN